MDVDLGSFGAFFAGERRQRVGYVGEHVEQVAFFGVDDLLHLGQLFGAESFFGEAVQELLARVSGALQRARRSASSLKNSGSLPNSISMNCCADMGVPSGCQKVVHIMCWIVRALPSASLTLIFCGARTAVRSLARRRAAQARRLGHGSGLWAPARAARHPIPGR